MKGVPASRNRELRALIDGLIADGATLDDIECEVLESAPVGEDARDALWLYAWGSFARQRPPLAA